MNNNFKSGFVTLIGRPNVGKSTLMNHLIGQKIAITSDKPQTTRNRIQTVYTDERGQVIFLDTPGIHKAKNKLGEYMVKVAKDTLNEIIVEMDSIMENKFIETFKLIQKEFKQVFRDLFKGGNAELVLTEPDNLLETGIEIKAEPPGKKLQSISLLSGGEKTFTAISLLFAILNVRSVPFCIFDEVEAALDDANVESFGKYLDTYKDKTQFIIITHKKKTMEFADILYGITMQESGVSKLVSVKLEDINKKV